MNRGAIIFWLVVLWLMFVLAVGVLIFSNSITKREDTKTAPTMAEKILKACGKKFKVDDWDILQPGEVIVTCYNPKNYQIHGVIVHYTPQ